MTLFLVASLTWACSRKTESGSAPSPDDGKSGPTSGEIPAPVAAGMRRLEQMLSPEEIAQFKVDDPARAHFNLGRRIRNEWGLWGGESPLVEWFQARGIRHPDDMSAILLTAWHRKLNGKPPEIEQQIQRAKDYWAKAQKAEEEGTQRGVLQTGIVPSGEKGWVSLQVGQIPYRSELARQLGKHAQLAASACLDKMAATKGSQALSATVELEFDADAKLEQVRVEEKASWRAGDAECIARSLEGAKLDPRYAGKTYSAKLIAYRK